MITRREKLKVIATVLHLIAMIFFGLAIIIGMALLIDSAIDTTTQQNQARAACWSEYENTLVESIPARCRYYMGFTK